MENFRYYVNPPEPPKIGFGKCIECDYLSFIPLKHTVDAYRSYPGPSDHNAHQIWDKKCLSKKGFSAFASTTNRESQVNKSLAHNFGLYDPYKSKPIKPSYKPFGVSGVANAPIVGPNAHSYPYHIQIDKPKINSAFGKRREIYPEVAVICSIFNDAKCWKCKKTPFGDYWRNWEKKLDMCRPCRNQKILDFKHCDTDKFYRDEAKQELSRYKQVRHCSFFHDHGGTSAATKLMPLRELRSKIRTENYLNLFPTFRKMCARNMKLKPQKKIPRKSIVKFKEKMLQSSKSANFASSFYL